MKTGYSITLFLFVLLFLTACQIVSPDEAAEPAGSLVIKHGISFGECLGYCYREVMLSELEWAYVERSWQSDQYPEKKQTGVPDLERWHQLTRLVNFAALEAMDDVYGCPDCADGGAEWIEVILDVKSKKITFEYGETPSTIKPLLEEMRAIRIQFEAE